jgi:predicted nucleotidyltransferase
MLDLKNILDLLKQNNVEFVVIGGVAAIAQGSKTLTFDFDFCYSRSKKNIANLVNALAPLKPVLRGVKEPTPFSLDEKTIQSGLNFSFSTNVGDVDIFGEVQGIGGHDAVLAQSEDMEIMGHTCRVLTLEGLIKAKKSAGRPRDLSVIAELEALDEIRRKRQRE